MELFRILSLYFYPKKFKYRLLILELSKGHKPGAALPSRRQCFAPDHYSSLTGKH